MFDGLSWKIIVGVIGVIVGLILTALGYIFWFAGGIAAIKSLCWPKRAKPEILDAKHCFIGPFVNRPHPKAQGPIHPTKKEVWFEFTADNSKGEKDCTLQEVSVELSTKGGKCIVNAEKHPFSTPSHKTIPAGQAKNIVVYGVGEPTLQPQENPVEGIITAKFNNGQSKNTKGIFVMRDWLIDRNIFTP